MMQKVKKAGQTHTPSTTATYIQRRAIDTLTCRYALPYRAQSQAERQGQQTATRGRGFTMIIMSYKMASVPQHTSSPPGRATGALSHGARSCGVQGRCFDTVVVVVVVVLFFFFFVFVSFPLGIEGEGLKAIFLERSVGGAILHVGF